MLCSLGSTGRLSPPPEQQCRGSHGEMTKRGSLGSGSSKCCGIQLSDAAVVGGVAGDNRLIRNGFVSVAGECGGNAVSLTLLPDRHAETRPSVVTLAFDDELQAKVPIFNSFFVCSPIAPDD